MLEASRRDMPIHDTASRKRLKVPEHPHRRARSLFELGGALERDSVMVGCVKETKMPATIAMPA